MRKILFIITKSEIGGAQKFVSEQIEISNKNGFKCFLATNQDGWLTDKVESRIEDKVIDFRIEKISVSYLFKLISFIKKNEIQLVVCNSANAGLYGRVAALFCRIHSIYVSHGWSSIYNGGFFSGFFNKIEWLFSLFTSSILCVSQNDLKLAKEIIKIPTWKLTVITNTIKPIKLEKKEASSNFIKILTVARLQKPKRVDLLVEAVKNIKGVELTIVGDGIQGLMIKEMILKESIDKIRMLGRVDGFSKFANYDIFALISDSEGLPLSALEAMSASNALVLSRVGGCGELISENGVLVDNNIESITNGISLCVKNLNKYQINSLKLFEEKFNLEKKQNEYINYYSKFCV